jgi:hypothetical protein
VRVVGGDSFGDSFDRGEPFGAVGHEGDYPVGSRLLDAGRDVDEYERVGDAARLLVRREKRADPAE